MRAGYVAQFGIIDFEEVAVFVEICQLRGDQRAQLLLRRGHSFQLFDQRRIHLGDAELERGEIHIALRAVVEVDRSLCDSSRIRNIVHRGIVESLLCENLPGGFKNSRRPKLRNDVLLGFYNRAHTPPLTDYPVSVLRDGFTCLKWEKRRGDSNPAASAPDQ